MTCLPKDKVDILNVSHIILTIVTDREGRILAKKYKIMFMETSAKTSENVSDIFQEISEKIVENIMSRLV